MKKNISLIIPTKNRHYFLKNALKSFSQLREQVEIFVIDDGSSEEQASLNKSFCLTIPVCQYTYFPKSQGAAAARNHGLDISHSDYIWFVDDDDFVPVKAIKDALKLVCTQPFLSKAILLPMKIMSKEQIVREILPSQERNTFSRYRDVGHQVSTSAAIFSRKLLIEIGGWDDSLLAGQDTDLFLRVSQVTDFKCLITEPVIVNVGHTQRISRAVIKQQIAKIQFLRKHWQVLSIKRISYYLLSFIFVAPLLNEPNLYRLRTKLLSR